MKLSSLSVIFLFVFSHFAMAAAAQEAPPAQHQHGESAVPQSTPAPDESMPDMPGMQHGSHQQPTTFIDEILHHSTSGTSAQPNSTAEPMIMRPMGKWLFMFHGAAFQNTLQQSGPRSYDKVFSTNWFMPMAQRQIGRGQLTFRTMLSLEPATVTSRYYPLPFQQGETAFGKPINDGQHPHDFVMELAALYDLRLGTNTACFLFTRRRSAIPPWAPAPTRIARQLQRTPWHRSAIICRIPRTSPMTL